MGQVPSALAAGADGLSVCWKVAYIFDWVCDAYSEATRLNFLLTYLLTLCLNTHQQTLRGSSTVAFTSSITWQKRSYHTGGFSEQLVGISFDKAHGAGYVAMEPVVAKAPLQFRTDIATCDKSRPNSGVLEWNMFHFIIVVINRRNTSQVWENVAWSSIYCN